MVADNIIAPVVEPTEWMSRMLVVGKPDGDSLPWLGHVIGNGTLKPDPEKVEAIVKMPAPTDKNGLIRLLGMVTYLEKFCKDLAVLTRPLRDMLKQGAAWLWDAQHEQSLNALKSAISSLPVLRLFDVCKPLVVSVDASSIGIGAVLLQDGKPVAFSSTSLTETQKRYCQIEKELLAVQFGLLRFRQYVYGQKVTIESDHKPLVGLLEKPIVTCSPRIQDETSTTEIRLSAAPSPRLFTDDVTQDSEDQVHHVLHSLVTSVSTRKRYAEATALDPTLQLFKTVIQSGWPEKRAQCPAAVKPYWSVRSELSMAKGILLCGSRLVVPMSLRRETMEGIHDGHFVTSSPEFAQSNGLVERHIQTVKRTLLKMFAEGKSLWEALAAVRSTPVSSSLPAPSVLLQGRNLRGVLPFLEASLSPKLVPASFVPAFVQTRPVSVRSSALSVGQPVRALVKGKWQLGVVSVVCPEPHSYVVLFVHPTHPTALVKPIGSAAVAVQSNVAGTSRLVTAVNTPSGQSSVFQSSVQQESTPIRSVEALSRHAREIPASRPARLFVHSASNSQQAPVSALGVTRSGRRYIKPPPHSQ
ncbi:hypothetical protein GHT06_020459 [Daphnia sinensis]|uniref:Reverse transcriptase/retrotransposon-derived protein RNase H-like domain-containing protein n=1 Tax=Daphnia sinensis TaxID=1820382 RepID=A0AAD5KIE4_9CRUS|nr:hypothetical protein GHT06_020459 [Daphnia sinensis]